MTPRKELYLALKEALASITQLELVDYYRNQFKDEDWTAAFIRINTVNWETMTGRNQEGKCSVDILFYSRDGWMDQHQFTDDQEGGLMEIDLIDTIVDKVQFLKGQQFTSLEQKDEEDQDEGLPNIMSYRLSFETTLYRKLQSKYTNRIRN